MFIVGTLSDKPDIPYFVTKSYLGLSMAIWNEHFGTQMTVILDLANKSWTNVAEIYFIGFVDPENISLGTKIIFLAGLEIKIS